ncbi:uncharacterized protein PV09_01233 [Verruconis gallopava]|uniref:Uncharacterized protein n=1 Tax=Verruconis gallopava TaxID=253628 RepID=A0A0D2BAE6_9PEZI|nr:uncharacterized protein PV09_01233 [Verruconis gallopava]KIW08314.1 hypothetical protein PV09_01233 [Verruconis gallopava]
MTKNVTKRAAKAPAASGPAIPSPFQIAPAALEPFLSTLSKESVYITHFDRHPTTFKKQIFVIPVLLNFAILMGLMWRLYIMTPWYFGLLVTFSQGPLVTQQSFDRYVALAILRRVLTFVIDYFLIAIVAKWPWSFFLESPGNPVSWRLRCGFREREIIVRISRGWGRDDLMGGAKKGAESPFFKTRLLPALAADKMSKTGYLLMDANWDLDFGVMINATRLLDKSVVKEHQLDRKVFVWLGDERNGEWTVWDEKGFAEETAEKVEELQERSNAEHREKIYAIQKKLQEMGKDELFFKWVELIQYESTQPGGFTPQRQLEAGVKVQALFEEYGVDFEQFGKEVGGMD